MRKILFLLAFALSFLSVTAQQSLPCTFEQLFTFRPGMEKENVLALLNQSHKVTQTEETQKRILMPYAKNKKDSILTEIITYTIDSTQCFEGRRRILKMEFADNRLYKAYISADFKEEEQMVLKENFDFLHKEIKSKWKYEKAVNFKTNYMIGKGYTFLNTQKKLTQPEYVSLQYITYNTSETAAPELEHKYTLEIIWTNLKNTRMQRGYF